MLRREMTLGRVGSGGSGGPIRVARVCPLVLRACPWCRVFPLARRPVSFPRIERHCASCVGAA